MPVVGRYGGPKVEPGPLPNAQRDTRVPSDAFQPARPVDLSGPIGLAQQIAHEETQKANEVAVLDADNQLTQLRSSLLYDPQKGVLSAKGRNAMDAASGWNAAWEKQVATIRMGLKNDAQRDAFDRLAQGQYARTNEQVESHVAAERAHYEQETVASSLDGIYQDAVRSAGQPDLVAGELEKGKAILTDWGRRQGLPPEQTQEAIAQLVSKAHAGVIEALSDGGNDLAAREYLTAHTSELLASDLSRARSMVKESTTKGESQRQADRIMASAPSLTAGLADAAKITDPEVRDQTERRVRQAFQDRDTAESQARDHAFQQASDLVRQTGTFDSVPWRVRRLLTPAAESSLRHLVDEIRHPQRQTDMALYTTLMNMAGLNPQTRQDFLGLDLSTFYPALADDDFQRLVNLQLEMRTQTQNQDRRAEELGNDVPVRPDPRLSIPQAWIEAAKTNPKYRDYLQHMGVSVPPAQP